MGKGEGWNVDMGSSKLKQNEKIEKKKPLANIYIILYIIIKTLTQYRWKQTTHLIQISIVKFVGQF